MSGPVTRAPIAVLGGGVYAARLAEVVAATAGLAPLELRLHARDRARLATIAAHADGRLRASPHCVRACPELDDALSGAAAVVLLVRVGGMAARAHDESFPHRHGLVGDEGVGVGGMANAWRTLPVLDRIARRIAACAAGAPVLNLVAPLGVTTRLLVERGLAAVGLCELPVVTLARWRGRAGPAAAALDYAGLNHLGFFWSARQAALDHPVLRAAVEAGDVPAEILAQLEAAPLHYYVDVFEPDAARRIGRHRRPGRAGELALLQAVLLRRFRDAPGDPVAELERRSTPWFEQALVPALHAALGGPTYAAAIDLVNRAGAGRALDEAPEAVVVELFGRLDTSGARFDPVATRPDPVRGMLGRLARAEDLLYRAALLRDRELLAEALDALPVAWSRSDADRAALLDHICFPVPAIPDSEMRRP